MALPGMRTNEEKPEAPTRRNRGRAQTQTKVSRPQALRPMASPVDTYSRPEQAPIGSNGWEALAKSLAGIQPGLNAFFQAQEMEKKGGDADINAVNAYLLPLSPEERTKAVREGKVPGLQSAAGREAAAERLTYDAMNQMDQEFATSFDPATGDIDAWMAEKVKPLLEQYGNDPLFRNTFASKFAPYADKLKLKAGELRSGAEMEARQGTVQEKWMGMLRFDKAEGVAPADSAAKIFGEFQRNQDYLRLDFKTQQQMALQAANQLATAGDYDRARALLLHERKDGPYKGSLMTDAQWGLQASQIMDRIDTEQQKVVLKQTAEEAETQVRAELASRFDKGTIAVTSPITVPTASGGTKEINEEEQEKMAAEDYLAKSDAIAKERGETKQQQFSRELAIFGSNGAKHPVWFRTINAGFQASSIANLAATGELPPALVEGYQMYSELHGDNPAYLAKHTEAKAADFYEAVRVAEEIGIPREAAMRNAAAYLAPGSADRQAQRKIERDKLVAAVDSTMSDMGGTSWNPLNWFGGSEPVNSQYVKEEIARYAQIYMGDGQGLSEDKALEKATERFRKNHIVVNGEAIKRDERMPEFFEDAVNQHISEFVKEHGEELGIDADDLTIKQVGSTTGAWFLYNRSTNEYIPKRFSGYEITYRSIREMKQRERNAAEQEVIKKHNNR